MNMQSFIIILILIIIIIPAIRSTITHFKGEGACCGGSKEKSVKKKINGKKLKEYVIEIEGMHCVNCKNRIERHLDSIDGVIAKVNLNKKIAVVSIYEDIETECIRDMIEKLDYTIVSIEQR